MRRLKILTYYSKKRSITFNILYKFAATKIIHYKLLKISFKDLLIKTIYSNGKN